MEESSSKNKPQFGRNRTDDANICPIMVQIWAIMASVQKFSLVLPIRFTNRIRLVFNYTQPVGEISRQSNVKTLMKFVKLCSLTAQGKPKS